VLSATIGGRARAVLIHDAAPRVVSPATVGDEVLEHLPAIARKRHLDLGILLPVLVALPIDWVEAGDYASDEDEARTRMRGRDEDDWPIVALALHLLRRQTEVAIWTQDRDLEMSRIPTLTTGEILDQLDGR
jgi:predicted nucleic acid-binding protein